MVDMVKTIYENCRMCCDGWDWSAGVVRCYIRVKRGCIMSGLLVLIVIDWVTKRTMENNRNGITWKLTATLKDLDFVDDQEKLNKLNQFGKKIGFTINQEKTKFLRYNPGGLDLLKVGEREVKGVESFVYLCAKIDKPGGTDSYIKEKIGKAMVALNNLNRVWRSSFFRRKTKIKVFNSNVVAVLLYFCETWSKGQI